MANFTNKPPPSGPKSVGNISPALSQASSSYTAKLFLLASTLSILAFLLYPSQPSETELTSSYALCFHASDSPGVYTVNEDDEKVRCLVVSGEVVVDTGDFDEVKERWNSTTGGATTFGSSVRYIPKGAVVIPGMSDSHCHILEYGSSQLIPLYLGTSASSTVALVAEYIRAHAGDYNGKEKEKVVMGWGWDHTTWHNVDEGSALPSWKDFEANPTTRGHQIILQSKDGHALWVSSSTLDANNASAFPKSVEGGVIGRDSEGELTGIFIDSAQDLIKQPEITHADLERRFKTTVNDALKHGLTSLHDAGLKPDSLAFFRKQAENGPLPIRIYGMTFFDEYGQYWGDQITPFIGDWNERLTARSVKIFADGALRTAGAALYEPYADDPSNKGAMRLSPDVLHKVIPRFLKDGWQVCVHAIGDRANGIVLDAYEAALEGTNVTASRPRLEHAQILTKEDMARVGKLGVIASIQPTHVISDMWIAEERLGPERVKGLYAFRSLINSGARITLGSDFPVEGINPLAGFYAAITRVGEDGTSPHGPEGWFPEQRLTRKEALRGMTIDPAYSSFTESSLGSLEPGKRADYVVLSQDIMSVPVEEILKTKVLATAIDGRVVVGKI